MEGVGEGIRYRFPFAPSDFPFLWILLREECDGSNGKSDSSVRKYEKPVSIPEYYPSRLEGLVWIRLGFSSDFPQELGLYA